MLLCKSIDTSAWLLVHVAALFMEIQCLQLRIAQRLPVSDAELLDIGNQLYLLVEDFMQLFRGVGSIVAEHLLTVFIGITVEESPLDLAANVRINELKSRIVLR